MLTMPKGLFNRTKDKDSHKLEAYEQAFLDQLAVEGETPFVQTPEDRQQRWEDFRSRHLAGGHGFRSADTYALDRMLIEMASADELRAEAPGLYFRYCEEHGENPDPKDPILNPAKDQTAETDEGVSALRARVLQMLRSLHWSYTFSPFREAERVTMIHQALWLMVGATIVLTVVLILLNAFSVTAERPFFAYLATIVYAGLMGGVVSWTQRLASISTKADAFGSIYALRNSKYMQYLAPLSGAVFAVVTMLLFMAKVFSGPIFPDFQWHSTFVSYFSVWSFTSALRPEASKDFALLFLWCFIAGFAERLIPDTLTQFAKRLDAGGDAEKGSSLPRPAASK